MSNPTTQEIRERDKRTGSCTYCWTYNDGLDAAADRGILLKSLDAAEAKLKEIHLGYGMASRKRMHDRIEEKDRLIEHLQGDREFFQKRDTEQCRAISRNHLKIEELKSQLAMVHRVSGCDQFRCVFSSRQDHCPEAIIHRERADA